MSERISWDDIINNRFQSVSGDPDDIKVFIQDIGGDSVTCCLESGETVMWWKGIQFLAPNGSPAAVAATQDEDRGPNCITRQVVGSSIFGWRLEILKAKGIGIHTGMYVIPIAELNDGDIHGKRITFFGSGIELQRMGPLPPRELGACYDGGRLRGGQAQVGAGQQPTRDTPARLKPLEEIEETGIPGLVEVLREEGLDAVRYVLWDPTGWHRDYSPPAWRNRATAEQKRIGWEMAVRIEKILCTVLDEAHKRQVEETADTLSEGPEGFYRSQLD